jgi:hypothetical protein
MNKVTLFGKAACITLCAAALILAAPANAAQPAQTLPPRPTLVPAPTATPAAGAVNVFQTGDPGSRIELSIADSALRTRAGRYAIVQWGDPNGGWHNIDGWQTRLDGAVAGAPQWWVHPREFGKGPFRWAVYRDRERAPETVSVPFWMPGHSGQLMRVELR